VKIILTLECETQAERNEAGDFADALRRIVERRRDQGFPGMILDQADSSVWVSAVELVESS
jgi:protein-disulfide isomerase-like protein with CxxC motif